MIDLQALVDGMSAQWQKDRAQTQMTLGKLIDCLEAMPSTETVPNICKPHSYRGYYSDLAFEQKDGLRPAGELLDECRAAMGEVFIGYKGGEFVMGRNTPLWISTYGNSSGLRLMDLSPDGIRAEPEEA
jgi:hypothetical protein